MLDAYLKELAKAKARGRLQPAAAAEADGGRCTAARCPRRQCGRSQVRRRRLPRHPRVPAARPGPSRSAPTVNTRGRARWLLHEAREKLLLGHYDEAQRKADEAEALNIKWGLFDDTPARVSEDIKKARPKAVASRTSAPAEVHDRRAAKIKLREARAAINDRNFEQAEAIALEVKSWGLSYGFFEDSPDRVASAARALRRRDKIRNTPARDQSSHGRVRLDGAGITSSLSSAASLTRPRPRHVRLSG